MPTTGSALPAGCNGTLSTPRNDRMRPLWAIANRMREWRVRAAVRSGALKHLHGPLDVRTPPHVPVVVTLVRNGEMWLRSFVEHYTAMGVGHIFLLDNGSTDATVRAASHYDGVSVFRTELPFRQYELGMRRWLSHSFGTGRWTIAADIDELWVYPGSDSLDLPGFVQYLERHGYQAVLAHMLDMFSPLPLNAIGSRPDDDIRQRYRMYDLSDVVYRRDVYWMRNGQAEGDGMFCTFDGIRARLFGSSCLNQSKHALHFTGSGSDPYRYDSHFVAGARIADVSSVLLHYKYLSTLRDQALENVQLNQHHKGSRFYRDFAQVLESHPDLTMMTPRARELAHVDDLVDEGLLTVSARYVDWIRRHGSQPPGEGLLSPSRGTAPVPAAG